MSLTISPETTVGALLEAYPQTEAVLVEIAPAFAKLRNPVVRRTVAKVATLQQAAAIGGVGLAELIGKLRESVGQGTAAFPRAATPASGHEAAWLAETGVVEEIDADAMLEQGVHPIGRVRAAVGALAPGELVLLRSSFRPEPLIETMRRSGAVVLSSMEGSRHLTWFGKPAA